MTTYSSVLAWRILWTEEPGGLQSAGSQSVRHGLRDLVRSYTDERGQRTKYKLYSDQPQYRSTVYSVHILFFKSILI